jgi:uncharacterized protein YnzC (UPF0291/DUF896 family)
MSEKSFQFESSKTKLKDNFVDITSEELKTNMDNLKIISDNINNFNNKTIPEVQRIISNTDTNRVINKDIFLKLLTSIYTLKNLEIINQQNAVSFHEFNKYMSPKQNIYYKQYL